jgi:cyclopropane-fatty-acyl-phospholipid synthase
MRDVMAAAAGLLRGRPRCPAKHRLVAQHAAPGPLGCRALVQRDAAQIQFHYDVSDAFYALWLDPRTRLLLRLFRTAGMTLAQAQEAKLDLICRKLRCSPANGSWTSAPAGAAC